MSMKGSLWISVSIFLAFCLTILPLPQWAIYFRPEWLLLVTIYWCMGVPHRVNVGWAWMIGLLLDVLYGTVLGAHALAFALVAYITVKFYRRIRFFPIWQQAISVGGLTLFSQFIIFIMLGIVEQDPPLEMLIFPSITSMLLWPCVFIVMRDWRQRFKIA